VNLAPSPLPPNLLPPMNTAPPGFQIERDLPPGFAAFYRPLHERFSKRQQELIEKRKAALARAHAGHLPTYLPPSEATTTDWKIALPSWCRDQRNQMTGPADEADLVVKMLNSGAPGVMLDLEDSMANEWSHILLGLDNVIAALYGELTYDDAKRGATIGINPSETVIWTRVRGLHVSQAGVYPDETTSASLFDLALLVYRLDLDRLKRPLCIYIPKSEAAEEALWWRDLFQALAQLKGRPKDEIKAMALCEAHRWRSNWKSLPSTCASICSGSISAAGTTWRASSTLPSPIPIGSCPTATRSRTTCRSFKTCGT